MDKEWFDKLTDAQKKKLREMGGNAEELIAFCREEKLDLPDDVMEKIIGGYCGETIPTIFDGDEDHRIFG